MKPDVFRQLAEEWIPFNKLVGIRAVSIERGDIRFEIPFRDELIGDPVKRALHGGVLSMLADTAGGFAVWTALEDERARVSTIDLRIDYLAPANAETLQAEAEVVRVGNRVAVVDIRCWQASTPGTIIATGKGVYNIRRRDEQA